MMRISGGLPASNCVRSCQISRCLRSPVVALATILIVSTAAVRGEEAATASDAAKAMVGAWEISNAARDKICPLAFSLEPAGNSFKLELAEACGTAFPVEGRRDVGARSPGFGAIARFQGHSRARVHRGRSPHVRSRAQGRRAVLHAYPGGDQGRHCHCRPAVRRMDAAAGIREAALQAHASPTPRRAGRATGSQSGRAAPRRSPSSAFRPGGSRTTSCGSPDARERGGSRKAMPIPGSGFRRAPIRWC